MKPRQFFVVEGPVAQYLRDVSPVTLNPQSSLRSPLLISMSTLRFVYSRLLSVDRWQRPITSLPPPFT